MVLTATQTATFFENDTQMGIPHDTIIQLNVEGVVSPRLAVMSVCRHAATPNDPTGTWDSRR